MGLGLALGADEGLLDGTLLGILVKDIKDGLELVFSSSGSFPCRSSSNANSR